MPSTIWHWKLPFSHFAIEKILWLMMTVFLFQLQLDHSDGIIITDYITSRA